MWTLCRVGLVVKVVRIVLGAVMSPNNPPVMQHYLQDYTLSIVIVLKVNMLETVFKILNTYVVAVLHFVH